MSAGVNSLLLILQFLSWGTALAGLAILTNNCSKQVDGNYSLTFFGLDLVDQFKAAAISASLQTGKYYQHNLTYECGMQYSWYWTIVFLQLVAVLMGLVATFTSKKSKVAQLAVYATVTALWCIWVYPMIVNAYTYYSLLSITSNLWGQAYCVASAGAVGILVFNFIYIFAQDEHYYGGAYQAPPQYPVGGAPAAYPPQGGFQVA